MCALQEWTEKRIRKELEVRLGESLSQKKAFIREKVGSLPPFTIKY